MRLELSSRAGRDIQSIRLFGLRTWGVQQANAYDAQLSDGLAHLQRHSALGTPRDDLQPGLRAWRVQQHRILYRVDGATLSVLRIVHVRQGVIGDLLQP